MVPDGQVIRFNFVSPGALQLVTPDIQSGRS